MTAYDPLQRYISLVPAGSGVFYALQADGTIRWYRNLGWQTGAASWANGGTGLQIGTGWDEFTQVIAHGDGQTLYGFTPDGNCHWYRYELTNWNTGAGLWLNGGVGKVIGNGFDAYPRILQGGWDGQMFCIDPQGGMWWFQYTAGNGDGGAGAWAGGGNPLQIDSGWQMNKRAWSEANGVIYGVRQAGALYWYQYQGNGNWANDGVGVQIGSGWGEDAQKVSFAMGSGVLYALCLSSDQVNGQDSVLAWYRLTNSQSITPTSGAHWANNGNAVTVGTGFTWEPTADLQAYAISQTIKAGGTAQLAVSTSFSSYTGSVVRLAPAANGPVTVSGPSAHSGGIQVLPSGYRVNGCGWAPSFTANTTGWQSGIYAGLVQSPGGLSYYAPFVVTPASPSAPLAFVVPVNTYSAYNYWAGHSRYAAQNGSPITLTFQRPSSSTQPDANGVITHTLPCDLFLLTWMAQNDITCDFYCDADLDSGGWLSSYKAIVLGSHTEYWSDTMRANMEAYLQDGGRLVATGGNTLYERCTYGTGRTALTWSTVGGRDLFINHGEPEAQIIGGSYNLAAYGTYAPYTVQDATHQFFNGTGLANGAQFGQASFDLGSTSGASGWEMNGPIDAVNVQGVATLLANTSQSDGGAAMVYIDRTNEGGGWVFAANSIAFNSSLPQDASVQQIMLNVFAAAAA